MTSTTLFPRRTLAGPTLDAAQALVGASLVLEDRTGLREGRIVEVEAYIGESDAASHARFGRTARNAVMFGAPGVAYVYLVYGMYHCLNVVTEPVGSPAAILIRAVEPIAGADLMRAARERRASARGRPLRQGAPARIASGPGLVGDAFELTTADTGRDLCDPGTALRLQTRARESRPPRVLATPRVGIGYSMEPWRSLPWRFVDADSPSLSGPRLR